MIKRSMAVLMLLSLLLYLQAGFCYALNQGDINLSHLDSLKREITTAEGKKIIVVVFASPADPQNPGAGKDQPAAKSGGIACVDDAARAAVVYMKYFEQFGDLNALKKARECLDFILYMQDADGLFYNFIKEDGSRNTSDPGSVKSMSWWTVRALYSLGYGYRVFKSIDKDYASRLEQALLLTQARIKDYLSAPETGYGNYIEIHGKKVPAWLLNKGGDVTSIAVLGLCEYYKAKANDDTADLIKKLCRGIDEFQGGDFETYPFYAHLSSYTAMRSWHAYGSSQIQALCEAGIIFNQSQWIDSAEKEANGLLVHLASSYGPVYGFEPHPVIYPQTSYSDEALASNLIWLYKATGKENYAMMSGLMASWLYGNNIFKEPMYMASTGASYDGLDQAGINKNSGAESTVEALLALLNINRTPAEKYLSFTEISALRFQILEAEHGQTVFKVFEIKEYPADQDSGFKMKLVELNRENSFWIKFNMTDAEQYNFYLVFLKKPGLGKAIAANMRIDGDIIIQVAMGGSPDVPYLTMEKVMGPYFLAKCLHTLGIRFSGLNFSQPAVVDCVVLQPLVERRLFKNRDGKYLLLMKSMTSIERNNPVSLASFPPGKVAMTVYNSSGSIAKQDVSDLQSNGSNFQVKLPPYGYATLEW
ncbi:MAG: hypothetical protein M1536_07635 [Firmicutes bacterium]|nr:hypothetical protein [Bacillota bacterium]